MRVLMGLHAARRAARPAALLCALLALLGLASPASCASLRGYDAAATPHYQYVAFGVYPTQADGACAPVLWRVLGPGTPQQSDVICAGNAPSNKAPKFANGDDLSGDWADVFCLMTEYVIDFVPFSDVRDEPGGPGLDYCDTLACAYLSGEGLNVMFTPQEQAVLVDMPGRGLLALPTRRGELFRRDYGFVEEDFTALRTRRATGTPYAHAKGLKRIDGHAWYFTADWRRYGSRWIVGDDGHISTSGADRKGGIRPVIYVHADKLACLGGSGTQADPLVLAALPEDGWQ